MKIKTDEKKGKAGAEDAPRQFGKSASPLAEQDVAKTREMLRIRLQTMADEAMGIADEKKKVRALCDVAAEQRLGQFPQDAQQTALRAVGVAKGIQDSRDRWDCLARAERMLDWAQSVGMR